MDCCSRVSFRKFGPETVALKGVQLGTSTCTGGLAVDAAAFVSIDLLAGSAAGIIGVSGRLSSLENKHNMIWLGTSFRQALFRVNSLQTSSPRSIISWVNLFCTMLCLFGSWSLQASSPNKRRSRPFPALTAPMFSCGNSFWISWKTSSCGSSQVTTPDLGSFLCRNSNIGFHTFVVSCGAEASPELVRALFAGGSISSTWQIGAS